jgi:hypothetical protein
MLFRPIRIAALATLAALSVPCQPLDDAYTQKIREYTTDPMFLTELVDHLPASPKVPTPEKILGYAAGAPDKLTYAKEIHHYMREVAKATPRVRVTPIGLSEEGREMILVLVSDEANLAKIGRFRDITAQLADPRALTAAAAEKLIAEGLVVYWVTGAIHSTETGAPEMLMELVYRLAVAETPLIQTIRKNAIVMVTPVVEVDGRERQVDLYRWRKANPGKPAPSLMYWGKYVAHDNNRDGMALSLALSRNITATFMQYHPQVVHDLHESIPFLYVSTGQGPYNAWLDPIALNEWQTLAWHEVEEMTRRGVPGVWTWGFYDGWGANYMMTVAHGHNSIGRFYETYGNGGADTRDRIVAPGQTTRAWYRQNPPLPRVKWSHRNNVNLQQSALLLALNYAARHRETYLRNFWLKGKRSVEKPRNEGPAAYVIGRAERPHEAASLMRLLQMHGVEIHTLNAEAEAGGRKFPAQSYVVRMDQPYSRMGDMLLDRQYYNPADTPPYDDTGWTLSALRNLQSTRVKDVKFLDAPMSKLASPAAPPAGAVEGEGAVYALNHNADRVLARFRFGLASVKMHAAEDAFEAAGKKFNAGSMLIRADENSGLKAVLAKAAAEYGLVFTSLPEMPKVPTHPLAAPRIALVHTWLSTQTVGWFRLALDNLKIPYTYISDQKLRETPSLRDLYDVIVFGPVPGASQRVVNGLPRRGQPVPWDDSIGPHVAVSPDKTADIRGGMGLDGLLNVERFVEQGGLFITIAGNSTIPVDYGLVDGVTVTQPRELRTRGSVLESVVADRKSPVAYGYGERLPVHFNQGPLLEVSQFAGLAGGGGGGGLGGQPAGRPSGRGGPGDPDVPQGRPISPPAPSTPPGQPPSEMVEAMRNYLPTPAERPRVILRFAPEGELLVSGMLAGGRELAGKAAAVSVPKGKGHYLLFAINPMWREQTHGSVMLVLNAAMNFSHLGAGRAEKPAEAPKQTDAEEEELEEVQ